MRCVQRSLIFFAGIFASNLRIAHARDQPFYLQFTYIWRMAMAYEVQRAIRSKRRLDCVNFEQAISFFNLFLNETAYIVKRSNRALRAEVEWLYVNAFEVQSYSNDGGGGGRCHRRNDKINTK